MCLLIASASSGDTPAETVKSLSQLCFLGLFCYGLSLVYLPAALMFGALSMIAALEVR